jgi:hypothetical protein
MFECFGIRLSPRVVFPSRKFFSQEILLNFMKRTTQENALPKLAKYYSIVSKS